MSISSVNDIQHIFYINLDSRQDRKEHVENELKKIGLYDRSQRFSAIRMDDGAIGCTMSHIKLLEMAKENNLDHILILEDDITFTNPDLFISQFQKFNQKHNFDVLLFGGNCINNGFKPIDDTCVKVLYCQTTTGYLVKNHYYDKLLLNFKSGLQKLLETGIRKDYSIDQYWHNLQKVDNWYLIIPLTVAQKRDYSNISGRIEDYSYLMLNLNKMLISKNLSKKYNIYRPGIKRF